MNLVIGVNPIPQLKSLSSIRFLEEFHSSRQTSEQSGEVVIRNHVVVREPEIQAVGVVGGHIVPDGAAVNIFHQNRTASWSPQPPLGLV